MITTAYPGRGESGTGAATSVRRLVNDEIARVAARLDGDDGSVFDFLCECGDLRCRGIARMTLADYRASSPGSVVGHA